MHLMHTVAAILAFLLAAASIADDPGRAARGGDARPISEFLPSRHGFAFVNSFKGSSLPGPLAALGPAVGAPDTYGLCGGMSFAAADLFLARRSPPRSAVVPTRGHGLYNYIYKRQIDSLGSDLTLAAQFARWMRLPDEGVSAAGRFTLGALPDIIGALERGEPVILGLVLVSAKQTREPWHNHQVLMYGASVADHACSLRIYDPNYPGADDAVVDVRLVLTGFDRIGHDRSPLLRAECTRVVGPDRRRVRGLFAMPYQAKSPPTRRR